MADRQEFCPDWASAPGTTIAAILAQRGMSTSDLATKLGEPAGVVDQLIKGEERIGSRSAEALAKALGGSPTFWLSRERRFLDAMGRLEADWVDDFPVEDMVKFGWIPSLSSSSGVAATLLNYFSVPSVTAWRTKYSSLEHAVAFRMSPSFTSHPAAVAAWLRQGEIEAEAMSCAPWSRERFLAAFPRIRELTRLRRPEHFLPKLRELCAECGVAVVVVQAPDGCRASGAARLLSPTLGVIQLSFRYLTDDHFWFTFFHEAGHLVLHGEKGLYLEGVEPVSAQDEEEANHFAVQSLIPDRLQPALRSLRASTFDVLRFASEAGVAPGIVVGQLQYLGIVPRNQLNRLKRRFQWESAGVIQPRKST